MGALTTASASIAPNIASCPLYAKDIVLVSIADVAKIRMGIKIGMKTDDIDRHVR